MLNVVSKQKEVVYGNFAVVANSGLQLTYAIPQFLSNLEKGMLCLLPLRKEIVVGVFLDRCEKPSFACVKVISHFPFPISFSQNQLVLLEWVSEYYLTPIGKTLHLLAPGFIWNVKKHKNVSKRIELLQVEKTKKIKGEMEFLKNSNITLNKEQNAAYENILAHPNSTTLLHGVTGAGKTEVYLKLAQTIMAQGKNALILVPEIALTPQMSSRFRAVFGDDLCVLHSGLAPNDYIREWLKIYFQFPKIVLGVRTAIFCPLQNVGLIIVDEEHDSSYKCSEMPCTNSRDVAVMRAKIENAICVLGSATPSLESIYNVKINKYNLVEMKEKYSNHKVESHVVNAKEEFHLSKGYVNTKFLKASFVEFDDTGLCSSVIEYLKENKQNNEQSMILINRRGYVNYALCAGCSATLSCPNCAVSTTLHEKGLKELCHYCGFTTKTRKICPSCGGHSFLLKGIGTQNVEEKLNQFLPELRISRLDKDVFTSNSRLTKIIEDFRTGKVDCLIGTQLLAKGHDFSKVTLVVILHVEDSLFIPDYRSAERTFQLITQAMGRAGRGDKRGRVILQSFIMNHPVVEFALNSNTQGFFQRELEHRKLAWHPPFCRQILFEINQVNLEIAKKIAENLRNQLIEHWKSQNFSNEQIRLAGPYQATIEKLNSSYRMQLCVSFTRALHPKKITPCNLWQEKSFLQNLKIDVDPQSFL